MGVEKEARAMTVGIVTEAHCQAGVVTWQNRRQLLPKFWARDTVRRAAVEPASPEGLNLDMTRGVMMVGYMVDMTDAKYVGRTVEAWSRTIREGDMIPAGGLNHIADTDPNVTTAIISQGFDLRSGEAWTALASFGINEHAEPVWHRQSEPAVVGDFEIFVKAVQGFVAQTRAKHSIVDMQAFIEHCGWRLVLYDG